MTFLFLAPLLLGRPLWPPSCLPFLAPIDLLADFIALRAALRVNILTIVFTTTLPMPPICLVLLPRWGCMTWELPQGTSGTVLCLVVYFDLFLAQVHFDGFLVPGDPLADTDLFLEHDLLGDNDFLLEDLHDQLVLADIRHGSCAGFPGLTVYRHPLDVYLLAPLGDPHHLTLCAYALFDVHLTGFALADAGSEFLLRALHPQVFLEDNALLRARPYGVVRRLFTASLVSQSGPFWAGSLCSERPKQGGHAALADASPEGLPLQSGAAAALGVVLDFDLFAPYVLLDCLGVLHHVLAEADLFLGHGALVNHDLFLGDRHGHLVLTDLGFGRLAFDGHPLDRYFLVLGRDLDLLAVSPYALADLHGTGLAPAGSGPELLLRALHPELVLVLEIAPRLAEAFLVAVVLAELACLGVAHAHARANRASGGGIGRASPAVSVRLLVVSVGAGALDGPKAVVGAHLVLVLGGDLTVVVEGRTVLDGVLGLGDLDGALLVVYGGDVCRDEGGAGAKEAHLHTEVLRLVALVEKQVVYLTDLRPALVHHGITSVLVFDCRESVAALFHVFSFS